MLKKYRGHKIQNYCSVIRQISLEYMLENMQMSVCACVFLQLPDYTHFNEHQAQCSVIVLVKSEVVDL